jgi:hypothetical protein
MSIDTVREFEVEILQSANDALLRMTMRSRVWVEQEYHPMGYAG